MQKAFLTILYCFNSTIIFSQPFAAFRTFTTADGLPSNHIYKTIEDNYGFLWVATDAGVARFDGKQFQVFTTRDGLPDNEVLDIVKEKSGTIWVNCFKQSPCYFDFVKNKFINANQDTLLGRVSGSLLIDLFALQEGGVMYVNENGSHVFQNHQLITYPNTKDGAKSFLIKNREGNQIYAGYEKIGAIHNLFISGFNNGKWIFSKPYYSSKLSVIGRKYIDNGVFYQIITNENKIYLFKDISGSPNYYKIDSLLTKEVITHLTFTKDFINLITGTGELLMYDKNKLTLVNRIRGGFSPNDLSQDQHGNYWVATIDKGLILYKRRQIEKLAIPDGYYNTHFLSIARKPDGNILAGNFNSEIIEANGKSFYIHKIASGSLTNWQRKIIYSQNKIFSFSEGGSFKDFIIPLKQVSGLPPYYTKSAIAWNDSVIIAATMGSLNAINTVSEKVVPLNSTNKRVSALAISPERNVYFGATDGLYKYSYSKDTCFFINKYQPLLQERVMSIAISADSLVWVATSSNGVVVVRHDTVVAHFTRMDGLISNDCKTISAGKPHQIWLGTGNGMSILNYTIAGNSVQIKAQNISTNDGLSSNIINEILFDKDTIYAATGNGISIIPASLRIPIYQIPVQLVGVRINQRDTILTNDYQLQYQQQNIQLQFAAIELSGHFKNLEYTLNNKADWIVLNDPNLNLQLSSGNYTVRVRAVDVNGNRGDNILVVRFSIASPFWKTWWFILTMVISLIALVYAYLDRINVRKRRRLLNKLSTDQLIRDLEMQSIKAQMNPHFVFNCLSSIKSLTYQQKIEEAGIFIDRFSQLMRNTLDYAAENTISLVSELGYIENYLALEQLRFRNKLNWTIQIAPTINAEQLQVPSLFLQPYVENSVKHGILHLTDKVGSITIDLQIETDKLVVQIDDNGVGREASQAINAKNPLYHLSRGMMLAERRASIYHMETSIIDKKNTEGKSAGTTVIIKLPLF